MSIKHFEEVAKTIPENVKIVAISKTQSVDSIKALYNYGHKIFGENKVQELIKKYELLPKDIEWHMVGHLQTNKVKYIAPFISLIQSVDSIKLMDAIEKEAQKNQRKISCLLQIHIAKEETKYGFSEEKIFHLLNNSIHKNYSNILFCGIMGMATFTNDTRQISAEFKKLAQLYKEIKQSYFSDYEHFRILSMGMSNDYKIAIKEGSNMIRLGSLIFGKR